MSTLIAVPTTRVTASVTHCFVSLSVFFCVCFPVIFHYSIPVLSHEVQDKSRLRGVFFAAFALSAAVYTAMGLSIASYFGDDVSTQSNLNWRDYVGCASPSESSPVSVAAHVVRFVVLVFPAVDVLSGTTSLAHCLRGVCFRHSDHTSVLFW